VASWRLSFALAALSCHGAESRASPAEEPTALAGVAVGGCGDVLEGPVCRLGPERKLRIFVPAGATDLGVAIGSSPASFEATSLGGAGVRLAVDVPEGAEALEVTATVAGKRARFTMRLSDVPPEPGWIQEVRARHRAGDGEGALRLLEEGERRNGPEAGGLDAHVAAIVASIRARAALSAGDTKRAIELLARSADLHAALGERSSASDDEGVRSYALIEELRAFGEAHASLARLERFSRDYPEGAAIATYYEGTLALAAGAVRAGLASLEEARQRAEAVGYDEIARDAESSRAYGLLGIGRVDEAYRLLEALDREQSARMAPCERATGLVNVAEAALLAREAHAADRVRSSPSPDTPLAQAEQLYRTTCLDAQTLAVVLLDQAWARLQDGTLGEARALIARARAATPQLDLHAEMAALDLEGRAWLAPGDQPGPARSKRADPNENEGPARSKRADPNENEGPARAALGIYRTLAARAAGVSRPYEASAAEGESAALERLGDARGALLAIERAESVLDEVARSVPLGEGRGAFWWSRAHITRRRVTLLVDAGHGAEALEAARAARARVRQDVQRVTRGAALPEESRRRWESALAEYARGREALVASAKEDWSLSAAGLERAAAARHVRDLALRAKLDDVARDVFPPPPPPRALATEPGTIALAWVPLDDGWAAFRVEGGQVHVDRVAAPTAAARAHEAAAALLASQAPAIRRAKRVQWLVVDALREVDLHGLSFEGEPLIARAPIEYVMDAVQQAASPAGGGALVVADPTETLPGARREGLVVAAWSDGGPPATLLLGPDATRARVLSELLHASSLHFSGHAAYAGPDGWDSALLLAGGERLAVADVLALPRVPARVILSGCETGKGGEGRGPPGLGLADAFIASGASAVLASTRRVQDEDGERLLRLLAPALEAHSDDVAEALREAQLALRRDAPEADWSAFRAFVR
jgi:hypothetical protein